MLAVNKLVLLIIFLVILLAILYFLFVFGKGTGDSLLLQNELMQCCGYYRANGCTNAGVFCDKNYNTIDDIRNKLSMSTDQLNKFCKCPE
jgi:hypothetical protein